MNKIVTLVTITGEIVGRLVEINGESIVLESPRLFVQTQQGAGFAQGVSMTGQTEPKEAAFYLKGVLCVLDTDPDAAKAWVKATSGLILQ